MKNRIPVLCLLCALAAVALAAVAVHGGGPRTTKTVAADIRPSVGSLPPGSVQELTAILDETRSVDTFLLTVSALAELGPKAKPAIRAIIRNAERLGVLKDQAMQATPSGERMRCIGQVHQAVLRILKGNQAVYPSPYIYEPAPYYAPAPGYAYPAPCAPPSAVAPRSPVAGPPATRHCPA
jgi:hypothetical protein